MAAIKTVVGVERRAVPDLQHVLKDTADNQYEFCVIPLVHPRFERDLLRQIPVVRDVPLTRTDTLLTSNDWSTVVVGRMSPWIDVDSTVEDIRRNSEKAFMQEVAWAAHLNVPALLLPMPRLSSFNYAQVLNGAIAQLSYAQIWVHVPLMSPRSTFATAANEDEPWGEDDDDPWEAWNMLRLRCEHSARLHVALELTEVLPNAVLLDRWISEPISAVLLPTRLFLTNKTGYPVLAKKHQELLKRLLKVAQHVVITGRTDKHSSRGGSILYKQYIDHLRESVKDTGDKITAGYNDYLQAPLQPLADNLESAVYEVFEQDPIKYKLYEQAIHDTLVQRQHQNATQVITVVGAGRGPLVKAALSAAQTAQANVRVYAVEKNPNAVVTLMNLKLDVWKDSVTVVASDMRDWKASEPADILVSELLGSFGDNELSPECLDGAQKFLKADGVSIPYDSTSFIAPLSTTKLFNDVANFKDREHFETPFVVKLENCWHMAPIQPLFKFEHPNLDLNLDGQPNNTRFAVTKFTALANGLLHGVAGYFESRLFDNLQLSIHPETHTPGMFSWFPIFFPITAPMFVHAGETIEIAFWRKVDKKKVWYEWNVRIGSRISAIHNINGRSSSIGL